MNLKLKQLRQAAGLSQDEMAAKLTALTGSEVKVSRYGTWERGERMLNLEQAYNCAVALGCTLNDLVGMETRQSPAENALLANFRELNEEGQEVAVNTVYGLRSVYKKHIQHQVAKTA